MDYSIAIAALKQNDPVLGGAIDRLGTCTLFEQQQTGKILPTLTRSIVYQQLSGKAAGTIYRRLLEIYPDCAFPSATDILTTPDETLRSAGLSRAKVSYLKDLARHVLDGLPTIDELGALDDAQIIQTLTRIKGIGCWSVQMLLMFRLHRWDILPSDDLGIRAGAKRLYQMAELPNKRAIEMLGTTWQPYRTIASWYLWRSADMKAD